VLDQTSRPALQKFHRAQDQRTLVLRSRRSASPAVFDDSSMGFPANGIALVKIA
jgi:hypothetical protein